MTIENLEKDILYTAYMYIEDTREVPVLYRTAGDTFEVACTCNYL